MELAIILCKNFCHQKLTPSPSSQSTFSITTNCNVTAFSMYIKIAHNSFVSLIIFNFTSPPSWWKTFSSSLDWIHSTKFTLKMRNDGRLQIEISFLYWMMNITRFVITRGKISHHANTKCCLHNIQWSGNDKNTHSSLIGWARTNECLQKRPFSWEPERTNYKRRINCRTYQTHMSVGGIERRLKDWQ